MISVEDSKQKTAELFNLDNNEDLTFIDEAFLSADAQPGAPDELDDFPKIQFGSGMAYGSRNGRPTYEYYAGVTLPNFPTSQNQGVACGANRWWAYQDEWDHENTNSYCGGNTNNQYYRIFKIVYRG